MRFSSLSFSFSLYFPLSSCRSPLDTAQCFGVTGQQGRHRGLQGLAVMASCGFTGRKGIPACLWFASVSIPAVVVSGVKSREGRPTWRLSTGPCVYSELLMNTVVLDLLICKWNECRMHLCYRLAGPLVVVRLFCLFCLWKPKRRRHRSVRPEETFILAVILLLPSLLNFLLLLGDFSPLQLCALLPAKIRRCLLHVISSKCNFWLRDINVDPAFMRSPVWLINLCSGRQR